LEELAYHFSCEGKEIFSSDELYDWIEEYLQGEKVPTVFRKTDTGELIAELSEEMASCKNWQGKATGIYSYTGHFRNI
jgi:hypothetical protein